MDVKLMMMMMMMMMMIMICNSKLQYIKQNLLTTLNAALTAVVFIRPIWAVILLITLQSFIDACTVITLEFVILAGGARGFGDGC